MIKGIFVINNHGKPRLIKDFQRMVRPPAAAARHGGSPQRAAERDPPRRPARFPGPTDGRLRPQPPLPRPQTQPEQQQTVREIFGLLSKRSDNVCNFLEGGR